MSQDLDRELARLYRVTRTVNEMLADRVNLLANIMHRADQKGYNADADWGKNNPFDYFQEQHGQGGAVEWVSPRIKMSS